MWHILSDVSHSKVITVVAYKFYMTVNLLQLGEEILHETLAGALNSADSHNSRIFKVVNNRAAARAECAAVAFLG